VLLAALANVPSKHGMHEALPGDDVNEPAGQGEHAGAPPALNEPDGHSSQVDSETAPRKALAVPAGHARHEELPWPRTVLYEPPLQGTQLLADVEATASRKKPAEHGVQEGDPKPSANDPMPHA
jgi:hypothetical protein